MNNTEIDSMLDALSFHHEEGLYFLQQSLLESKVIQSEDFDNFCDECEDYTEGILTGGFVNVPAMLNEWKPALGKLPLFQAMEAYAKNEDSLKLIAKLVSISKKAESALKKKKGLSPDSPEIIDFHNLLLLIALDAANAGLLLKSREAVWRILAGNSKDVRALNWAALLAALLENEEDMKKLLAFGSQSPLLSLFASLLYFKKGKMDEAAGQLDSLKDDPDFANIFEDLGKGLPPETYDEVSDFLSPDALYNTYYPYLVNEKEFFKWAARTVRKGAKKS